MKRSCLSTCHAGETNLSHLPQSGGRPQVTDRMPRPVTAMMLTPSPPCLKIADSIQTADEIPEPIVKPKIVSRVDNLDQFGLGIFR